MLNRTRTNLTAATLWTALCLVTWPVGSASAQVAQITDVLNDKRRALVLEVLLRSDGTAQHLDTYVTDVPPATHLGDPPLILIETFDTFGNPLDSRYAWDPRWELVETASGDEQKIDLAEGEGEFDVAFDPYIAMVKISDVETALELITVDVESLVLQFCIDNPVDANCAAINGAGQVPAALMIDKDVAGDLDLSWDASCSSDDDDYAVYEGDVGNFASHALVQCGTGGITTATVTQPVTSKYYLVVPLRGTVEGSYGLGNGVERSPAAVACETQLIAQICP